MTWKCLENISSSSPCVKKRNDTKMLLQEFFQNVHALFDNYFFTTLYLKRDFFHLIFFFQLYLSQYGYLGATHINKNNSGALVDEKTFQKGIEDFQMFAGLDITGEYQFSHLNFGNLVKYSLNSEFMSIWTHFRYKKTI